MARKNPFSNSGKETKSRKKTRQGNGRGTKHSTRVASKRFKKKSPVPLKIKSPKETGKSFISNSKLKVKYFSKYVDYPVISDDSGLCIEALKNKPGIYSARLAKKHGSFLKAMKFILKKLENEKNRKATFVCSLSYKSNNKIITKLPVGSAIIANNYFWLHGRKPFKENKELNRELLRIRGSFFIN